MIVIAQRGERAVTGMDPGHLLDALREKGDRVRDVIPGEDEEIRLQGDDLVGIAPQVLPGHEEPRVDIRELDHPQGAAEGKRKLPHLVGPSCIGGAVSRKDKRRHGQRARPGLQEAAPAHVDDESQPACR